uniref:hypothetical protein n=1 Tax=Paraconexibacter sp. TaxID=2949640 RepID=UPI003569A20D
MENDTHRDRFEAIIATLLGLAAILVAVASYQGSLRDGDSIKSFNEGIRSINDANGFFTEATQTAGRDQALFLEYAKAAQSDNADLASYLKEAIMDDNLRGAVDAWENDKTDEIATPLDAPEYEVPQQNEAERLVKVTDRQFATARSLDEEGDKFNLVGVIVASSLFFLGIAGVVRSRRTR